MAEHEPYTFPGSPAMAVRMLCRGCGTTWPCLTSQIVRLTADLAAANATIAAQSLALATLREALEHVLTESEWVKKRNEWSSHGQTVGMQPTADRACQEIHYIARLALAQPAAAAAALAAAVLEAGDQVAHWLHEYRGVIQVNAWRNDNDSDLEHVDGALDAYRRARSALRGTGAGRDDDEG